MIYVQEISCFLQYLFRIVKGNGLRYYLFITACYKLVALLDWIIGGWFNVFRVRYELDTISYLSLDPLDEKLYTLRKSFPSA